MNHQRDQSGITLNGFIVFLLVFSVIAFGAGWLANKYYSNRLFLAKGTAADFPAILNVDASPAGLTWDGKNLVFSNRAAPWGVVRITPLENGHFRKASIPVVDPDFHQQVSFSGITWNGNAFVAVSSGEWFQSSFKTVFVELHGQTLQITKILGKAPDFVHCITWDGQNFWAGTRLDSEDQPGPAALYKFDQELKLVSQFTGAGKGCQGMTWDGKFLWWGDVFTNTATLFNIYNSASVAPAIVHQYKTSIRQQSGIAFDGQEIWFGDDNNGQLNRLNQDLYFDWLGGHYDISEPGQLKILERINSYQTANKQLDDLIKPLLQGNIKAGDIPSYVINLKARYSDDEIRQLLLSAREKVSQQAISDALELELKNLVDTGKIDYIDDAPIAADEVKFSYFHATIEDGDLLANWKVTAGSDILVGIDSPRPQQISADYDFYTFIHYTITISDLMNGDQQEQEYEFFGTEDVQEDVVLLQNIKPGEYLIGIDIKAQYYTATEASRYAGKLEIKVIY